MTAQFLVNILSGQSNKDFVKSNKKLGSLKHLVRTEARRMKQKEVEKGR